MLYQLTKQTMQSMLCKRPTIFLGQACSSRRLCVLRCLGSLLAALDIHKYSHQYNLLAIPAGTVGTALRQLPNTCLPTLSLHFLDGPDTVQAPPATTSAGGEGAGGPAF